MAASSFCREFSEQQKVEIDFTHEGMPSSVPKEISLCLFRILQEALQNAVKYSGVRHFTVKLEGPRRRFNSLLVITALALTSTTPLAGGAWGSSACAKESNW